MTPDQQRKFDTLYTKNLNALRRQGKSRSIIDLYARDAGIQKRVSPNSLRHAYGACLVEAGLNLRAIQESMGHASPVTTARYTQITEPAQQNSLTHIVRDYGFLHGNAKRRLQRLQYLLRIVIASPKPREKVRITCPCCQAEVQITGIFRPSQNVLLQPG